VQATTCLPDVADFNNAFRYRDIGAVVVEINVKRCTNSRNSGLARIDMKWALFIWTDLKPNFAPL